MKTSEIELKEIGHPINVKKWLDAIENEKHIDTFNKEEWIGEHCYEIWYKKGLVGFISYSRWNENDYCLSSIYIYEWFRHKGIATAAIRKLEYALKNRAKTFYGFVHKDNKYAIQTYLKLEFRFLNKDKTGYVIDTPNKNNYAMVEYF